MLVVAGALSFVSACDAPTTTGESPTAVDYASQFGERLWPVNTLDDILELQEIGIEAILAHFESLQECSEAPNSESGTRTCRLGRTVEYTGAYIEHCRLARYRGRSEVVTRDNLLGIESIMVFGIDLELTDSSLQEFGLPQMPPDVERENDDGSLSLLWLDVSPLAMIYARSPRTDPTRVSALTVWFQESRRMQQRRDDVPTSQPVEEIDCSDYLNLLFNSSDETGAACFDPSLPGTL